MDIDHPENVAVAPVAGEDVPNDGDGEPKENGTKRGKKRKRVNAAPAVKYFVVVQRPSLIQAWPNARMGDIKKKLKQTWSELSPEEKQVYEELAHMDAERRKLEGKRNWLLQHKLTEQYAPYYPRRPSESPKRNMSAYFFFFKDRCASIREQQPMLSANEVSRKLAETWRQLPASERAPFEELATKDKERYLRERGEIPIPPRIRKPSVRVQTAPAQPKESNPPRPKRPRRGPSVKAAPKAGVIPPTPALRRYIVEMGEPVKLAVRASPAKNTAGIMLTLKEQEQALLKQVDAASNTASEPFPPQSHAPTTYDFSQDDGEFEVMNAPGLVIPSSTTL